MIECKKDTEITYTRACIEFTCKYCGIKESYWVAEYSSIQISLGRVNEKKIEHEKKCIRNPINSIVNKCKICGGDSKLKVSEEEYISGREFIDLDSSEDDFYNGGYFKDIIDTRTRATIECSNCECSIERLLTGSTKNNNKEIEKIVDLWNL